MKAHLIPAVHAWPLSERLTFLHLFSSDFKRQPYLGFLFAKMPPAPV